MIENLVKDLLECRSIKDRLDRLDKNRRRLVLYLLNEELRKYGGWETVRRKCVEKLSKLLNIDLVEASKLVEECNNNIIMCSAVIYAEKTGRIYEASKIFNVNSKSLNTYLRRKRQ